MDVKKLAGNTTAAFLAQGVNVVVSIITTLLLPKIMGVEEFGYWQLFIFYVSYVGFFHLGLNDGVYLLNGGKTRAQIDRPAIASQFAFGMVYQSAMALALMLVAWFGDVDADRGFVVFMTALYLVVNNAWNYLGYTLQAMNETKRFSMSVALNGLVYIGPLVLMILLRQTDFMPYVVFYTIARTVSLGYCLWQTRDILNSGLLPLKETAQLAWGSIRVGAQLMIANVASTLILGISRFLIDAAWGIEVFSIVSFSISMTTFILTFVNQVSMVLFPALRQEDDREVASFFVTIRDGLDLLLPASYLFYAPVVALLDLWVPAYHESLVLFALLLPLCVFDGKMDLVGTTYLKVLRGEGQLLRINLTTVAISTAGALVSVYGLHSVQAALLSSVVALGWRCWYSEHYVGRCLGVPSSRTLLWVFAYSAVFAVASFLLPLGWSWLVTAFGYVAFLAANRAHLNALVMPILRRLGRIS